MEIPFVRLGVTWRPVTLRLLTIVIGLAVVPASAQDWSGRFLGPSLDATDAVSRRALNLSNERGGAALAPGHGHVQPAQVLSPEEDAFLRRDIYDPEMPSAFTTSHLELLSTEGFSGIRRQGRADGLRIGLGLNFDLSEGVVVQGGVLAGTNAAGWPSLSPENRQLALIAAFRF